MASTFTVTANPIIEARIANDLILLREAIFETINRSHIRMLALGGGFGRGEGTAFLIDDQPHIVNDYDIRIVHDLPHTLFQVRYGRRLNEVAEKFAKRLAIKQIDFGSQHYGELSHKLAPTIANYELFHGNQVFYGEDLLTPKADRIPVERIPLSEGIWLLRNRIIGLILAGLYFLDGRSPGEDKRENLWIEANKALLATGDSFLLAQSNYHWSYVERGQRIAGWQGPEVEAWRETYCRAISEKVNPDGCPYDKPIEELIQDWYRARRIIEQGFCWFEFYRTGRQCEGWGDYLDHCAENLVWRQPRFWGNLLRVNTASPAMAVRMSRLRTERTRSIGIAARLLFAVREDTIDSEAVDHVEHVMGLQHGGTPARRWCKLAAFLLSSIHPTGEAGRVAQQT